MPLQRLHFTQKDTGAGHDKACPYNASISPKRVANLLAQLKAAEAPDHDILPSLGNDLAYQVTYHH